MAGSRALGARLAQGLAAQWRLGCEPDEAVLAELYRQMPAALAGHLAGAAAVVWMYAGVAPAPVLLAWVGAFSLAWALRLRWRWRAAAAPELAQRQRGWNHGCLASGAMWAAALLLLAPAGDDLRCAALMLLVYAYCMAAPAATCGVFLLHALLCTAPMVWLVSRSVVGHGLPLAGLLVGALVVTLVIGAQYRRGLGALAAVKRRAQALAQQLAQEKAAAEEVTRATSRFYAAASHDLRQPLLALGLCAGSLARRPLAGDSAELVRQIEASTRLLESLFDELLDLNRLDAGGIQAHVQPVRMGEVYERLRLVFGPQAFERGLALRFRGASRVVHTDALLLERILRNLLANALACTDDGSVLLGCRRRGGQWHLEVWDSGIGIEASDLPHLFDEFYQVESGRRRGHGMGLGLAIVRRLAALLGGQMSVRSVPGRGSVFTLHLPMRGAYQDGDSQALTIDAPSRGT